MKRKKFLLLFGSLLILVLSYAGWCGREFFIHPKIERGLYVPDEAWTVIEEHFAGEGFPIPHFKWDRFLCCLMRPYEANREPARTWCRSDEEIYVYHQNTSVLFLKTKSHAWKDGGVHREHN